MSAFPLSPPSPTLEKKNGHWYSQHQIQRQRLDNLLQSSGSISAIMDLSPTLTSLLVEILLLILDKVSLVSCARVNISLNRLTTPLIWRTTHVDTLEQLNQFKSTKAQHVLIRNAHNVHELLLNHPNIFDIFDPHP